MRTILITLWVLLAVPAMAQTQYVSDELEVTLRTGPTTRNAIVRILKSGTPVEVLEQDEEAGWSRVRAGSAEGWMLSRFLMNQPAARARLAQAVERQSAAERASRTAQETAQELREELAQTRQRLGEVETASETMATELNDVRTASANAISLRDQNKTLRQRALDLDREMNRITQENRELRSRARREGIVIGAAILFGGIVLGLILPRLKPRRRSEW